MTAPKRITNSSVRKVISRRPRAARRSRRLARLRSRRLGAGTTGGEAGAPSPCSPAAPSASGDAVRKSAATAASAGTEASPSSPTTTSTTTVVMLSLPPWERAARTNSSAARRGSATDESTSASWAVSSSLVRPSLHSRYRSPRTGWIFHRSTVTSGDTPRALVRMCRCGCTAASAEVNSPVRTISSARLWPVVIWIIAVVEPVGARIADVDQGQDVVAVLVDHGHGGQRGAPVSYTHLRAHETDSYL